jgi:hypothetical protein
MKFLVSLLSLISLAATANVGDSITHNLEMNGKTGFQKHRVSGFDAQSQAYMIQNDVDFDGANETNFFELSADELFTKVQASQVLQYCDQLGGALETVLGHRTCKVSGSKLYELGLFNLTQTKNTDVVWIGSVPVNGVVKAVLANGLTMTIGNYNWSK